VSADPARFDRTLALPGGELVRVRPIRPDDAPRLSELYDRLSQDSRYQRFFSAMRRLPPDWARFLAAVDHVRRFALVAEDPAAPERRLIAVARYEPSPDGIPEIAEVVEDRWQGKGLGARLLVELFHAAAANGIARVRAFVLGDNRRMLRLLERHADVLERTTERGVVELLLAPRA
jgi:acetyltransferase